jgi:hypothetical protein
LGSISGDRIDEVNVFGNVQVPVKETVPNKTDDRGILFSDHETFYVEELQVFQSNFRSFVFIVDDYDERFVIVFNDRLSRKTHFSQAQVHVFLKC